MDLISFGQVFLEVVFGHLDQLPLPGEEIFIDPFAFSLGGAITVAVTASQGGVSAGLATLLGDDLGSRLAEEHSRRVGVDLSASQRVSGAVAGITVVLNFEADRAFISHRPPALAGLQPETQRWTEVLRRQKPSWCYLHAGDGMVEVVREARSLGTRVALDLTFGAIEKYPDQVVECARFADVFLPNEEELRRLTRTPDLAEGTALASSWCPRVVVKRGAAGATVVENGHMVEVTEGLRAVVARDRTGAGDAFAGALIAAMVHGAALVDAVAAGNTAGSLAVAQLGAVGEVAV
jgi:sugar/nucleoside kinase (ribokinase family)